MPDLDGWLKAALEGTGVDPEELGRESVQVLLDLARDAAHNVARPAAPLATFAAGLALGRAAAQDLPTLKAEAARITAAADAWLLAHPKEEAGQ